MSILGDFLLNVGNGALQTVAQAPSNQPVKKGRKAKKGETCTPCQAMANVDAHRSRLGYSIK